MKLIRTIMLLLFSSFGRFAYSFRLFNAPNKRFIRFYGVSTVQMSKSDNFKEQEVSAEEELLEKIKDRPFTLPPGLFRPKQSLGQNYLSDQNYVRKIVDAFSDDSENGHKVVEIGPGTGALTRVLVGKYPEMTALEIDQRAVAFLNEKLPQLNVKHQDVLDFDWPKFAAEKGGRVNIIANLPYYIVSQVLFSLADSHLAIRTAVVTMQLEVAQRIIAKPNSKQYGIPSVVFQLYGNPKMNFKIPPKVFFPVPGVDSALLTIDFTKPHEGLKRVNGDQLRKVVTDSFRQRRKMLRQSLKGLLNRESLILPEKWETLRPEQLTPEQFIDLTIDIYGTIDNQKPPTLENKEVKNETLVKRKGSLMQRLKDKKLSKKLTSDEDDTGNSSDLNDISSNDNEEINNGSEEYTTPKIWHKSLYKNYERK